MSIDLGRRLIASGLVSPEEVEAALFFSVARGVPFARVLIDRGAITERGLEEELERVGGLGLRQVAGASELVARLPRALCRRLAALPTRVEPGSGAVDVAAADPLDPHIAAEIGFHLGAHVRVLRAPIGAVEEAIRRLELEEREENPRVRSRRVTPAFPHGAPQSSIPPPVLEEAPIPLVRKAAAGANPGEPPQSERRRSRDTLVPPSGVPEADGGAVMPVAQTRPMFTLAAGAAPPAVSFPSVPPAMAAPGERVTPPYGTPLHELGIPGGAAADLGYRIAPPDEDPLAVPEPSRAPRGDVPPPVPAPVALDESPTLPSTLSPVRTVLGQNPGPRRPARPPLPGVIVAPLPEDEAPAPPLPKRARMPDLAPITGALAQASGRDDVIRASMRGMRLVAKRVALFAVKRDGFHGWACNADLGDQDELRALMIPADEPSVLATAAATAIYLGPIPDTAAHEALLAVMDSASSDVAAVAVRVAGRPALILLCDDLDDTMMATRFLGELAHEVGEALARMLAR